MAVVLMNEVAEFPVPGVHSNKKPPLGSFLEGVEHFHVFKFRCCRILHAHPIVWSASNFQNECKAFIQDYFTDSKYTGLNFEQEDCITLAELLISNLKLNYCSVMEEGVGGIELILSVPLKNFDVKVTHERKVGL